MKKILKGIFNWTNVFGTISIFGMMWLLNTVVVNLDFLNIFGEVLNDYRVTDVLFAKDPETKQNKIRLETAMDTNIVIVNIGELDRADIAQQIMILNKSKPRVIGLDILFKKLREPEQDSLLAMAMAQTENLVLGTILKSPTVQEDNTVIWDSLQKSHPIFQQHGDARGFVNTISSGDSQFETWREAAIRERMADGKIEYCFAAEILSFYNPNAAKIMKSRNNEYEIINYRGNLDKFTVLETDDVLEEKFDPNVIRGKIVLLGYLGKTYTSTVWSDDKYYTPMNERQVGRTSPDMYGIVGHANIISMALQNDYINELPAWTDWTLAFLVGFINVALFSYINFSETWDIWYGILTKLIQLVESIFLIYLVILFFANYNIKIDFTVTIAVILLSGDILEIYFSLFLALFEKAKRRIFGEPLAEKV
jgi:CHASE2 domain-containing sensor protein